MGADVPNKDLQEPLSGRLGVPVLLGASAVLGVGVSKVYLTGLAVIVVVAAVMLIVAAAYVAHADGFNPVMWAAVATSGVFLAVGYVGVHPTSSSGGSVLVGARVVLTGVLILSALAAVRIKHRIAMAGVVVVAATILVVGAWTISVFPQPDIDVFELHVAAADVLRAGGNPYEDVAVVDTSPLAEPSGTLAYPYPPLAVLLFSLATWTLGDPRWAGVLAMVAVPLIMLGLLRRAAMPMLSWIVALVVGFAANPGWPLVVRFAWTDAIGLPFLVGGAMLWRRSAIASGVLIGLGFATKQYYVIALPLLLVVKERGGIRRFWSAAVTAAALVLPAFVVDFDAAWDSLVWFHLTRPPRLDGASLAGLGIDVPSVIMVLVVGGLAVWFGRQIRGGGRFMVGLGAVLAALFVLGSQAFGNYWFLVVSMILLGLALALRGTGETTPELS